MQTKTEIYYRNKNDPDLDPHPNHNRLWLCKNLRCANCVYGDGKCALCKAPCCAYKGAKNTLEDHRGSFPNDKVEASRLMRELNTWCPNGVDETTFMDCTECCKIVCPECIGVCPTIPCRDRVCKVTLAVWII